MDQLDLKNAVLVGHSTGGGEVTSYIGRHRTNAVRQDLSAERLSNVASIANHGGIEHNRGVSVSDFAGAGRPRSCDG